MNPFPLVEIILWLALFFAPADAVEIILTTPEGEGSFVRTERGWSGGGSEFWLKDDTIHVRQGGHEDSQTLTEYIYPVLTHDWTRSKVLAVSEMSTVEMKPDGFIMRINIGSRSEQTYAIRYVRGKAPTEIEPAEAFTINVLGDVVRPGVYTLPVDSRLLDAIKQAGGYAAVRGRNLQPTVTLSRGPAGHHPVSFRCGVNQADGDSAVTNIALQAHDTVFVSRSTTEGP